MVLWRLPIARKTVAVLFICANSRPSSFSVALILFVLAVCSSSGCCRCRHSFTDFVGCYFPCIIFRCQLSHGTTHEQRPYNTYVVCAVRVSIPVTSIRFSLGWQCALSIVLFFIFCFFFSLRQSCSNIGSRLQTVFSPFRLRMCYTLRRDLDLAWHRISGNVISMPRHSAKYIAEIFIDKRTIACVSPIHTHKVVRGCGDEDAECVLVVRVLGSSLRRRRRRQFLYLNFYRIHLDGMAKCHRNSLTNNQKQC